MKTGNIISQFKILIFFFFCGILIGFLINYKPKPQETELSQQEICQNLEAYLKTLGKKKTKE